MKQMHLKTNNTPAPYSVKLSKILRLLRSLAEDDDEDGKGRYFTI